MNKRKVILTAIGIAAFSFLGTEFSAAYDYPFCRKGDAGPGDCRYDTYEQCLAAVSGTASYCQPNYWLSQADRNAVPVRPRRAPRY